VSNVPIDVTELPEATNYLNFCKLGPPVGKYLGPNTMGEYVTVVSNEPVPYGDETRHRIGVAFGIYTIGRQPTDPEGFPAEVALAILRADQEQWRPRLRDTGTPGLVGRTFHPTVINDPEDHITVTHLDTD
jgi:hypothetical protein